MSVFISCQQGGRLALPTDVQFYSVRACTQAQKQIKKTSRGKINVCICHEKCDTYCQKQPNRKHN